MNLENAVTAEAAENQPTGVKWRKRWESLLSHRHLTTVCLILILLLGAVLRFTGVNWDDHTHLHPDERHVYMVTMGIEVPKSLAEYFDTATSPLNPYNRGSSFVYGTLPLFLTKILGEMLSLGGGEHVHLLGRVLSAVFDLLAVYVMFLIGRKLYGVRVGLLSALLSACLVIHIQQSHFYGADTYAAAFIALTFYFAVWVVERGSWGDFLRMGICFGLAAACKINVILFGPTMVVACLMSIHRALRSPPKVQRRPGRLPGWKKSIGGVELTLTIEGGSAPHAEPVVLAQPQERHWLYVGYGVALKLAVSLVVAFFVFRIVQPYSFQGPGFFDLKFAEAWLKDMQHWSKAARGEMDFPFDKFWTARAPVLYSLENMILWAVGVPLGLASWAGWALAWFELWRKRNLQHVLALMWTSYFFLYQSTRFGKLSRYLTPFFPFMAMLAAYLLVRVWDRAKGARTRWVKRAAMALVVVVAVGTVLWAFAFSRIYTRPMTRVAASLWAYDNIPPGSAIAWEHWDDIIPWGGVGGRNGYADGTYTDVEMHPYAEDEPQKLDWYVDWLTQSDYVILSSNRVYGSVTRLPMRYPMMVRYYDHLFSGELGFELIKTFTSRPNLGPIEFVDDNAEEPFTVYDHPRVDVFRKTEEFAPEKVRHLLGDGIDWENIARIRAIEVPSWNNGLQLSDEEKVAQQSGGTWSDIFNRESLSNAVPVIMWLLLVEVLGVITLPLADVLFHSLADRGYALAKPLGVLLLTWLTWMLVNLGVMQYDRVAISIVLLLMTACGALLFWRKRERLIAFWKEHWRLILINEAVFLL